MTLQTPKPVRKTTAAGPVETVDEFMAKLKHPHHAAIEELRRVIRDVDPSIAEGVKGNAPSFRTTDYFATIHLRANDGIGIVLHLGAKVRETPSFQLQDPRGLMKWLAKDRALISFSGMEDVKAHAAAIQAVVRQWVASV